MMKKLLKTRWIKIIAISSLASFFLLGGCWRYLSPEEKALRIAERIAENLADDLELNPEQVLLVHTYKGSWLQRYQQTQGTTAEIFDAFLTQANRTTVDQNQLNEILHRRATQIQENVTPFVENFAQLHASMTIEQRSLLIGKLEKSRKKLEKRNKRFHTKEHIAAHLEDLTDDLELNPEQVQLLQAYQTDWQQKHQETKGVMQTTLDVLISQANRDTIDQNQLNEVLNTQATQIQENLSLFVENFAELHTSLSAEQRILLIEKLEKWKVRVHRWSKFTKV